VPLKQNNRLVKTIEVESINYCQVVDCFRKERFLLEEGFQIEALLWVLTLQLIYFCQIIY
jgi:hypothetical protein